MDAASHALPAAARESSSDKRRGGSRWQRLGSVSLVGCLVGIVVLFGVVLDQRGQLERLSGRFGDHRGQLDRMSNRLAGLEAEPLRTATNDVLLRRKRRQATFNSGGGGGKTELSWFLHILYAVNVMHIRIWSIWQQALSQDLETRYPNLTTALFRCVQFFREDYRILRLQPKHVCNWKAAYCPYTMSWGLCLAVQITHLNNIEGEIWGFVCSNEARTSYWLRLTLAILSIEHRRQTKASRDLPVR